jgi:tRNA U34 5-methylaminomethyl-2-thiouridine-forming methyltransferase MnmC
MILPPKNYSWLETEDGSLSLFSEAFGEGCHSTSGAKLETITHYIRGCDVLTKAHSPALSILEVGWGLGLGYQTTIEELIKHKLNPKLHFVSMEIDPELILWSKSKLEFESFQYPTFSMLEKKSIGELEYYEAESERGKLTILSGDARMTVPLFHQAFPEFKAQALYQDAFSPKKNPTLWTVEWFETLKSLSAADVKMSTYSSSNSIRKSMLEAGWKLNAGERFGKKRTSTRASLQGESDQEILKSLSLSPILSLKDEALHV